MCDDPSNLQLMKSWLLRCSSTHTLCAERAECFLPNRLLDVKAFGSSSECDLKLVTTKDLKRANPRPEYITVSHCWGSPSKRPIITSKANLQERMMRITFNSLPKTFCDAVRITRQLDQRYLWLDSLCIIQDDEADWAIESELMGNIYSNSYCTIAALSSCDSTIGFHRESVKHSTAGAIADVEVDHKGKSVSRFRLLQHRPRDWQLEYNGVYSHGTTSTKPENIAPLRFRAWALQEQELSQRAMHFGKGQLLWECKELRATAQLPWVDATVLPLLCNRQEPDYPVHKWYTLVEEYALRSLTFDHDKLPALSGLASRYQAAFPDSQYIAGLWTKQFPRALLWYSQRREGRRSNSYIAPTWSWASLIEATIKHADVGYSFHRRKDGLAKMTPVILQACTRLKHTNSYGAVLEVCLILAGAYVAQVDPIPQNHPPCEEKLTKDGHHVGYFHRDTREISSDDQESFILFLDASQRTLGLLLTRDSSDEPRFRRLGMVVSIPTSVFQDCIPCTITLV